MLLAAQVLHTVPLIVLRISEEQRKLFVDFTWLPTMLPTKCLESQGIKTHLKRGWSIKPHPFQKHYGMFPRNLCSLCWYRLHGPYMVCIMER